MHKQIDCRADNQIDSLLKVDNENDCLQKAMILIVE